MRTSRISRDTSRILAATRNRPLRRTRAANALNTVEAGGVAKVGKRESESAVHDAAAHTDSELSSVPDDSASDSGEARASRKRKRGQAAPVVVKREARDVSITAIASPKKEPKPKKARRVPAKRITGKDGEIDMDIVKVEPPPNWEEMYALTRQMRNENVAPVDTMGCESLADRAATPRDQRFQTLVSLMLSSQTKDTVTSVAIKGMQENMPGGFNLESVLAIEPPALNAFINKVGFHNLKTKYIKQAAEILRDKWDSDIPGTIEGLISLPGVGPKMAYLCMSAAWGRDEGIGVDVHVHRITNLWGWHKTKQPEETRAALESWLPKEKWHDINNLLVGFGQSICLPVGRKCADCKLADKGLCPSAAVGKKTKIKEEITVAEAEGPNGLTVVGKKRTVAKERIIKAEDVEGEHFKLGAVASGSRHPLPPTLLAHFSEMDNGNEPKNGAACRQSDSKVPAEQKDATEPTESIVSAEPITYGKERRDKAEYRSELGELTELVALKAQRAQYPLSIIFAYTCLAVLFMLTLDAGVVGTRGIIMPTYWKTVQDYDGVNLEEISLASKLESLQNIVLHKRLFENHPQCLARAINDAHDHYGTVPYQSIQCILDGTIDWAQSECDRLLFTPEVSRSGWSKTWFAVVATVKGSYYQLKDTVHRWYNINGQFFHDTKSAGNVVLDLARRQKLVNATKTAAVMSLPRGFEISYNEPGPIHRLFSTILPDSSNFTDIVTELDHKRHSLDQTKARCQRLLLLSWNLQQQILVPLQAFLGILVVVSIAIGFSTCKNESQNRRNLFMSVLNIIGSLFVEMIFLPVYFKYLALAREQYYIATPTTASVVIHYVAIISFIIPLTVAWLLQSVFDHGILWALQELYAILYASVTIIPDEVRKSIGKVEVPGKEDPPSVTHSGTPKFFKLQLQLLLFVMANVDALQLGREPDVPRLREALTTVTEEITNVTNLPGVTYSAAILQTLQQVQGQMQQFRVEMQQIRVEMQQMRGEMQQIRGKTQQIRGETQQMRVEMQQMRVDMEENFAEVRQDIRDLRTDLYTGLQAVEYNTLTRIHNSRVGRPNVPLVPLHNITTNVAAPGFPPTPASISNMTAVALDALLQVFGLPTNGTTAEKKQQLRFYVGLMDIR
ncbi:alpha,alpha-trehalase nth1 [Kalmusia sp. IMI 367209]|nr:alpha,alpha-trehalase nth1 [Kalmusia sp. IMI 367209]